MILKILGLADFTAAFSLMFFSYLPRNLVVVMGLYLIIKGLFFTLLGGNMVSMLDCAAGIYHVMATYGLGHWVLTSIIVIFVFQKAFVSFFS